MTNTNDRADERVTVDPVTGEWRAPDRADVAAERDEALKKWTLECGGAGLHVSSLMSSAYRDGWNDARAASSAVPDGGTEARLKIANDCCDRLMQACTDAGCPDGVRMDDWIRANVRADGGNDSNDAYVNPSDVTLTRHQKDELLKVAADMVTEGDEELAECLRALVVCAAIAKEKK